MIVKAKITYENEFEMEVPDDWFETTDDCERYRQIIDEDECLGGDWDAWAERLDN